MTSYKPRAAQPPVPDFAAVLQIATAKGAERVAEAGRLLQEANTLVASAAHALQPLVGPTAAQALVLCRDVRSNLSSLQNGIQSLVAAVERMKEASVVMSEDSVLQEIARSGEQGP